MSDDDMGYFDVTEPAMTAEKHAALRKPFPKSVIGRLPKLKCKACSDARDKCCATHSKAKCKVCGNYLSTAHIDLNFVGHAPTTDRLLEVDPGWTWEPMATDEHGAPALDRDGNLWIRLTVCGVTRPGCGDGNNMKERIGDAIRNAAMRFGVALDLWAKDGLESELHDKDANQGPPVDGSARGGDAGSAGDGADSHDVGRTEPEGSPTTGAEGGASAPPSAGPCSICGSTRAQTVMVRGIPRCSNASDCKKRAEEKQAVPAGSEPF